jgi:membrane protease YdiL (CAAX protease family)
MGFAGVLYIAVMLVVLPLLAVRSAMKMNSGETPLPARSALHLNTILVLGVLLIAAVLVNAKELTWVFRPFEPDWTDPVIVVVFLFVTVTLLLFKIRRLRPSYRDRLERITMSDWRDPRQFFPFLAVAIMAGIAEETAYRGVLFELLNRVTDSWLASSVIASLAFGVAHAVQGWRSAVVAAGFGLLFHVIVLITGDLYSAMAAHAVYDIIAGIVIAEYARRRLARPVGAVEERTALRSGQTIETARSTD